MKHYQNDPEDFPELREKHLKLYAKRWAKKYNSVPIESIILYRCHSVYQEYLKDQENLKELNDIIRMKVKAPTKYALIFNTSLKKFFEQTAKYYDTKLSNYSHCEICKIMNMEDYRGFLIDTEYYDIHKPRTSFLSFLDGVFPQRVYKEAFLPEGDFRDEWIIQPKTPNDEFYRNVMTDEPYPRTNPRKLSKPF